MKRLILSSVVLAIFLFSCKDEKYVAPSKGRASFSLSQLSRPGGREQEIPLPAFVLINIDDSEGNKQENIKLSLFDFGHGYISEDLELPTGNYQLTKFLVLGGDNSVIYATPLEGTSLAKYVEDPLPISFLIDTGGTTVVPQVIAVEPEDSPEDFGYLSFGFDLVTRTTDLEINLRYPDYGTYDSAFILFKNSTAEIKQKLTTNNSNYIAFGVVSDIPQGEWKVSISFFYSDAGERLERNGSTNINISRKAIILTSNEVTVSIKDESGNKTEKPIHFADYYYNDLILYNNIEGFVRHPKDPIDPFFEISISDPGKWEALYIYYDRFFWNSSGLVGGVGSEINKGDASWNQFKPEGDIVDTTSFKFDLSRLKDHGANLADAVVIVNGNLKNTPPEDFDEFMLFQDWDLETSASNGRKNPTRVPAALSKADIEKRKEHALH